jgi:hemoglobin-like flavoprotein
MLRILCSLMFYLRPSYHTIRLQIDAMDIEKLENLSEAVGRMCHEHTALEIQPSNYQIVHDNRMEAIGDYHNGAD